MIIDAHREWICGMVEWRNGGLKAERRNGGTTEGRTAETECRDGEMAGFHDVNCTFQNNRVRGTYTMNNIDKMHLWRSPFQVGMS